MSDNGIIQSTKTCTAQCNSIRIKAGEDYRNIRADIEDNAGAENAGLGFGGLDNSERLNRGFIYNGWSLLLFDLKRNYGL